MPASSFDFAEFINRIVDLDYRDMLAQAERERGATEAILYDDQRRTSGVKAARAGRYLGDIGQFVYFLRRGRLPSGVAQGNVALYQQVCEALVAKGQLEPSRLEELETGK